MTAPDSPAGLDSPAGPDSPACPDSPASPAGPDTADGPDTAPPSPDTPPGPPALQLDCRGLRCPLPVIKLAQQIRHVGIGQVVRVLADDPAAANDIPAWCRMKEQEYLGSPAAHAFDVRRLS